MISIRKLKEILRDWPEVKENGDFFEVWLETGLGLSSQMTNYSRLGQGDLLLESDAFEKNSEE